MQNNNETREPLHQRLTDQFIADLQVEYRQDLEWMTRPRPIIPEPVEPVPLQPSVLTKIRSGAARMVQRKSVASQQPPVDVIEAEYVILDPSSSRQVEEDNPQNQSRVKHEQFDEVPGGGSYEINQPAGRDRTTNQVRDGRNGQSSRFRSPGGQKNRKRGCSDTAGFDD